MNRDVEDDAIEKAKALRFKAKAIAKKKTRKRRQQRGTPSLQVLAPPNKKSLMVRNKFDLKCCLWTLHEP
jgi:hypothetical protein